MSENIWHGVNTFAIGLANGIEPKEHQWISEWAVKNIYLPKGTTNFPGYFNFDYAPYARDILDIMSPQHPAHEIVVIKGTQIAGTQIANIITAYYIENEPCPIGFYMPTEDLCKNHSKDRFQPMMDESDSLKNLLAKANKKGGENLILHKKFPGGYLHFSGTKSSSSTRNTPYRILIIDDADGMDINTKDEGTVIGLIRNRADTYKKNYKLYLNSTPKVKSVSNIYREFARSTQGNYNCPCPNCGKLHYFTNKDKSQYYMVFEKDEDYVRISEAKMKCPSCLHLIDHSSKAWMMDEANGAKWVDRHPKRKTPGRKIPSFLSKLGLTWNDMADEFLEAIYDMKKKADNSKLLKYVTTRLAEAWEDAAMEIDSGKFMLRREEYQAEVPYNAMVLTCGVDVQGGKGAKDERLEATVVGWGGNNESWTIEHKIFYGDPTLDAVWDELDEYLQKDFNHEIGKKLNIAATFVDSGGNATQNAYTFCNMRRHRWIFAIKGRSETSTIRAPILNSLKMNTVTKENHDFSFFMLGTNAAKDMVTSWMQIQEHGAGYMHFPKRDCFDKDYFEQLTAEKMIEETRKYDAGGKRNEAFDCWIYAYSAFVFLKLQNGGDLDWVAIETNLND